MRFAKKEFEVQFDPKRVSPKTLVETAAMRGRYRASQDGPVRSRVKATALTVEGVAEKAAYSTDSKGRLQIVLTPEKGKVVMSAELTISGPESIVFAKPKVEVGKPLAKPKALLAEFKVGKKAERGRQEVTVKLTYKVKTGPKSEASHTTELRLSVFVE